MCRRISIRCCAARYPAAPSASAPTDIRWDANTHPAQSRTREAAMASGALPLHSISETALDFRFFGLRLSPSAGHAQPGHGRLPTHGSIRVHTVLRAPVPTVGECLCIVRWTTTAARATRLIPRRAVTAVERIAPPEHARHPLRGQRSALQAGRTPGHVRAKPLKRG
eukprot:SAG31_NODE_458_length_15415_cov_3.647428_4_plen_167_part_00